MWCKLRSVCESHTQKALFRHADLSGDFDVESEPDYFIGWNSHSRILIDIPLTHRILDPKLGGGALLDLGPYPFLYVS